MKKKPKTVRALLSSPARWCRKDYAQDNKGNPVSPLYDGACRFCLAGAITLIYGLKSYKVHVRITEVLDKHFNSFLCIHDWNDTHAYKDVRRLLAIAKI